MRVASRRRQAFRACSLNLISRLACGPERIYRTRKKKSARLPFDPLNHLRVCIFGHEQKVKTRFVFSIASEWKNEKTRLRGRKARFWTDI